MAFVLDTHVWLWLAEGARPLDPATVSRIDEARPSGEVFVSVMSIWELALLEASRKIYLSLPLSEWVQASIGTRTVVVAALTPGIAIASTRLPGEIHRDPSDRIIVATARALGATLVTRDRRLAAYGRAGHLDVLEA
jgi:PIN domain nuclease of toxin-antitoxin system